MDNVDEPTNNANTNDEKTFKSDECAICLSNPPNILLCSCGHLCLCIKCNKAKGF